MIPDLPPWATTPPPAHCPDCHRVPQPGERHGLLDGVTDDGEPLGFTCLDADDRVIFDPPEPTRTVTPDPWSTEPTEPPPF